MQHYSTTCSELKYFYQLQAVSLRVGRQHEQQAFLVDAHHLQQMACVIHCSQARWISASVLLTVCCDRTTAVVQYQYSACQTAPHCLDVVEHLLQQLGHLCLLMQQSLGHGLLDVGHGPSDAGHGLSDAGHGLHDVGHGLHDADA